MPKLARLLAEPIDDGAPIAKVRFAEGLVVPGVGNKGDLCARGTACSQVKSHLRGEEVVFFAVDDENGDLAVCQRRARVPNGRDEGCEGTGNPGSVGRVAKRREGFA